MNNQPAYTLIELMVSMASASVLMVGLSGALFVSAQALDSNDGAISSRNATDQSVSRMLADIREAREFTTLTPDTIKFLVPDRNGDGLEDEIHYTWDGTAGSPLHRQVRGGPLLEFIRDVQQVNFTNLTRTVPTLDVTVEPLPPWPILESWTSALVDPRSDSCTIAVPTGAVAGELLIAMVATDNDRKDTMSAPGGWAAIDLDMEAGKVTFGIWWKSAGASEPADYTWAWSGDEEAVGLMLRISNQYPGNPITGFVAAGDKSRDPTAPMTVTTLDHSMLLRVCGFDKGDPDTVGATGVAAHTDVYMDGVSGKVGVGCCYAIEPAGGSSTEAAEFELKSSADWRALTLVIAPKP